VLFFRDQKDAKGKDQQVFAVAAQLSGLARDMTNRDALKNALLPPQNLRNMVARTLADQPTSSNIYALRLEKRHLKQEQEDDKQRELRPEVMVPWVHWPGHSETGDCSPDPCRLIQMLPDILFEQAADTTAEASPMLA
jgi:hypothetical protein